MTNKYYGYPKEIHQASEIYIKNEIIVNQSSLIENALKLDIPLGGICIDNIRNLVSKGDEYQEILEWWLITKWLAEKLEHIGEPILETDYGFYWGRTCSGQAIILDGTIQRITTENS